MQNPRPKAPVSKAFETTFGKIYRVFNQDAEG
jgi:hypothetical protein